MHVDYYTQRASAGFIISECTPISDRSVAWPRQPGLYTQKQMEGWKSVTDSVHKQNGLIFAQIYHAGRASHSSFQNGLQIWGPSAIAIKGQHRKANGVNEVPKEMTLDDIKLVKDQFYQSAQYAKLAGFDGVELHGAHGYLIDSFLRDYSNRRKDDYGGKIENRCKLCLEVIDIFTAVFGEGRVGIKISPVGCLNDMNDSNPKGLLAYLVKSLNDRKIAFIEVKDDDDKENQFNFGHRSSKSQIEDVFDLVRPMFQGVIIGNNNFTPEKAMIGIQKGKFDAVTFGRLYVSNPDLVERISNGWPLNENWDSSTFYSQGRKGYTDYPRYQL